VSQQELLTAAVRALDAAAVPYMLTGSVVSSFYGEPRATHDFDFVVALGEDLVPGLHSSLARLDGHVDVEAMRRALRDRTMFNYIDHATGLKVDFWMIGHDPYDVACFARRRSESLFGTAMSIASAEDIILIKLRWAKRMGGSTKQFTDALRVLEVQRPVLDFAYIERWANALDARRDWERLQREARPID
jgi:hypothetical protein